MVDILTTLKQAKFDKFEDYDVIGFDVDHCLAQYNIPEMHKMTYKAMTDIIVNRTNILINEKGYPKIIQNLTEEQMNFSINAVICDFRTGCLVKIGAEKQVLRAYHGFHRLSQSEIESLYGPSCIMEAYQEGKASTPDYYTFITYFDTAFTLMFAAFHEFSAEIKKSTSEIMADIWYTHDRNYKYSDYEKQIVYDKSKHGCYYPAFMKEPTRYTRIRTSLQKRLQELKDKNIRLFIATNSLYDVCEMVMEIVLGKDWKKYFDISITGTRKPLFFDTTNQYFYADASGPLFRGAATNYPLELQKDYVGGNAKELEQTFEKVLGKSPLKILYVGDQHINDSYSSQKLEHWDALAVVEELSTEKIHPKSTIQPLLNYTPWWGSLFYEEDGKGNKVPTIWTKFFTKVFSGIISNLED